VAERVGEAKHLTFFFVCMSAKEKVDKSQILTRDLNLKAVKSGH
jgi:hypothetical protein